MTARMSPAMIVIGTVTATKTNVRYNDSRVTGSLNTSR
jgi:hypothetical protein